MNDVLVDTHIAVWLLFEPVKLSAAAVTAVRDAEVAGGRILVSAITPIEVTYLIEKGRLPAAVGHGLWAVIADPAKPFDVLSISADVARSLDRIPRGGVPDLPDRVIAATALTHRMPLVSADRKVRSLTVPGLTVLW